MRHVRPALILVALAALPAHAQPPSDEALHRAFVTALRPALPFPEAGADACFRTDAFPASLLSLWLSTVDRLT